MVLLRGIKHGWLLKGTHRHSVLTSLKLSLVALLSSVRVLIFVTVNKD